MTTKRHPITVDGETYRVHVAAGVLYAIRPGPWGLAPFGIVAFADTREELASEIRRVRSAPDAQQSAPNALDGECGGTRARP